MRKERWPGEQVLLDNVDVALRSYYAEYFKRMPDHPDYDADEEPDYVGTPMMVGWIVGIQTLGDTPDDEVDAYIPLVSEGMSTFTAMGMSEELHKFFGESN